MGEGAYAKNFVQKTKTVSFYSLPKTQHSKKKKDKKILYIKKISIKICKLKIFKKWYNNTVPNISSKSNNVHQKNTK